MAMKRKNRNYFIKICLLALFSIWSLFTIFLIYVSEVTNILSHSVDTHHSVAVNKPVLFVHFHKAGGTSVIDAFTHNSHQYRAFPVGQNGIPATYLPRRYIFNSDRKQCEKYYPGISIVDSQQQSLDMNFDRERYNLDYNTLSFRIKLWLRENVPFIFNSTYLQILDPQCFEYYRTDIMWDTYSNERLEKFLLYLSMKNINFMASEMHFYKTTKEYLYSIQPFQKLSIFTMIRDPYQRFLSFYYFCDRYHATKTLISKYEIDINLFYYLSHPYRKNSSQLYRQQIDKYKNINKNKWKEIEIIFVYNTLGHPNFYIRYLNGFISYNVIAFRVVQKKIFKYHLSMAKQILQTFDVVAILELPQTWKAIEKKYNVKLDTNKYSAKNTRYYNSKFLKNYVPSDQFEIEYKKENVLDYQFYQFAVNLSLEYLRKHDQMKQNIWHG